MKNFEERKDKLFYYSPYNFVRSIASDDQVSIVKSQVEHHFAKQDFIDITVQGKLIQFLVKFLPWDTDFFGFKTYKLYSVLYPSDTSFNELIEGIEQFKALFFKEKGAEYCFLEIPSEDIFLIQALNMARFKLSETRLTYFNDQIQNYEYPSRYKVRKATADDIANLRDVASLMRNDYDRFHADVIFDSNTADSFLSKYIEEAIKGFSDLVLVPDAEGIPSDSFLTANYLKGDWSDLGYNISKMVLSAVSSATNKGWYVKLISEMTYHFKEQGVQCAFMNTQSTNRAVFRVWEKLGYRLGATTHILSYFESK